MRLAGRIADQAAFEEDWGEERDIVEMASDLIGVVDQVHVSLGHRLLAVLRDRDLDGVLQRAEEDGKTRRLPEKTAVFVEQGNAVVLDLVDDRRVRAAREVDAHLVGGRVQCVADDLDRDWVDGGDHAVLLIESQPWGSELTVHPSGTTVVQESSSMMQGAAIS